ncbi:winged helix-turn-helix domain-containing protein [Amycolatopsis acidiphila]|uniref:Winged helix-turn-helix transcriptional regulator n=1 Tax=Amycolatopsis acidiphila TaxID=715473 RepID=A0A558A8Y7_9PSEU|nr:winged helix-turn-helix domain-containing protein [Amycolatopsis acidiphila]TVT20713.1 winged helix-turn-helix transcriptional regulator [Amycolatopsis acidiphila]UIJ59015.1 winged helix-turn-helix domain-containing protein [Amycolatopsis acidiphila]
MIDFEPNEAVGYVYEQMYRHLAARIESGELKPGTPLPSERRLASEYGVSLGTARHATRLLKYRGLVVTVRAKGTYVVERQPPGEHPGPASTPPAGGPRP